MKVYAYLRVSGRSQVDGDGFDRQLEAITAYAAKHRHYIDGVYREEAVSGTTAGDERPAFTEMLTAMLTNGVKACVVEGLDRLAREYRVQETMLVYLASKKLTLLSARTEEDVTAAMMDDPMRRALIQIQGVFAELEKGLLVKKLRHAREAKRAATGKCEGRKSYREVAGDALLTARLRRDDGWSHTRIANQLNCDGVATLSGGRWTAN